MTINEIATFLQLSCEQVKTLIANGIALPKSGTLVKLAATVTGERVDISEQELDEYIHRFEDEEPGRHPPVAVCRELLTEARHHCAICKEAHPLQFHHMVDWAKLKHHDTKQMIAICGSCHSKCTKGVIDYKAQLIYKGKLNKPIISDEIIGDVTNEVCKRVLPPLANLDDRVSRIEREIEAPIAANAIACNELKAAFARSSTGLLRWPTTVSGDHWLDRPELKGLLDRVCSQPASLSVVLGPLGCGKSAFLARFGQQLVTQGTAVLAIKADQLQNTVDSAAKLAEHLHLPILTDLAVLTVAKVEPVVVLIDQLDALADLADLRSERLHVLLNLIDKLAGHPRVQIVCSCREIEYQHDGRLNRLDAHAVRLQPPAWEQVSNALSSFSKPPGCISAAQFAALTIKKQPTVFRASARHRRRCRSCWKPTVYSDSWSRSL